MNAQNPPDDGPVDGLNDASNHASPMPQSMSTPTLRPSTVVPTGSGWPVVMRRPP